MSPPHKPPGPTLSRPCCRLCSPSPRRSSPDPGCACGREPGSSYAPARELACPPSSLPLAWRPGAPRAPRPPRHTAAGPAARAGKRPRAHSGAPCRQRGGGSPPPLPLPSQASQDPPRLGTERPGSPSRHICLWGDHRQTNICRLVASGRTKPDLQLPPHAGGGPAEARPAARSLPAPQGWGRPRPVPERHSGCRPPPPPVSAPLPPGEAESRAGG